MRKSGSKTIGIDEKEKEKNNMQNYEELYEALQPMEKALKDSAAAVTRLQKAIQKNTDAGNLTEVKKNLEAIAEASAQVKESIEAISGEVDSFDTKAYFADGDFTKQLLDSCAEKGVDVRGEKGVYEMFPYKVRISGDGETEGEVTMNRKKIPSFRPSFVAETIRAGQEKLFKANFNVQTFMSELADAYETACMRSGGRAGGTQSLDKIYKYLAPTSRARKEYDKQAYAFDLARLYEKGTDVWVSKAGKKYYFGTSRDGKSGIRVLSSAGVESFISTLKMVQED